jgi:asparagine synthase (glutamine-hydrolysing)
MLHRIVTERVRDMGHDALFSGLGGDEASCGEIEEYLYYFADLRRLGMESRIQHDMNGWIEHHATREYPKGPAVLDAFLKEQIDVVTPGRNLLNEDRFRCYFHALSPDIDRASIPIPQLPNPFGEHLLNKLYQDLFFETVPCVVRAETANARATGLPTLYPYLDADVMRQGFSTPLAMRYRDGVTKAVVRKATRGLVPDSARNNPTKRGWNAPVDQWLRGRMNREIEEILSARSVRERGVYDIPTIRRMLAEHVGGQRNHMMFFWQLISYERWYREIAAG